MHVEFVMSEAEIALAAAQLARRHWTRWAWLAMGAATAIGLLLHNGTRDLWVLMALGAFVVGAAVSVWSVPAFAGERAVAAHRRYPQLHGTVRYEFSDSGVTLNTPASRTELPWSVFTSAREDEAFLYLHLQADMVCYLPKRALEAARIAELRALLRDRLGDGARL